MKQIFNWPRLLERKQPNVVPHHPHPHHGLCWCNFPLKKALNTGDFVLFSFMCHLSPKSLSFSQYQVLLTSVEISFDFFVSACSHSECVFLGNVLASVSTYMQKKKKLLAILYVSFHLPLLLPRITSAVLLVAVVTGQPWPQHTRHSPSPRPSAFSRARPRSGACTPSSGKGGEATAAAAFS